MKHFLVVAVAFETSILRWHLNSIEIQLKPTERLARRLQGTRTELLRQVADWSGDPNAMCVFWLCGMAESIVALLYSYSYPHRRKVRRFICIAASGAKASIAKSSTPLCPKRAALNLRKVAALKTAAGPLSHRTLPCDSPSDSRKTYTSFEGFLYC